MLFISTGDDTGWTYANIIGIEIPQGSDWLSIVPHCVLWPQASVGNVTWADEDL